MIPVEGGASFFCEPLPDGFMRSVIRVAPGLGLEPERLAGALVIVQHGELEIECTAGTARRFGRGSMVCIARVPVARLRNSGHDPLVLVAVSRLMAADEFRLDAGSYCDD